MKRIILIGFLFEIGIALLISGVVITETVFNIPGLGKYFVGSVFDRDIPVVGGTVFFFAALILGFNLLVDIVQAWLNPKVRLE